jgi:hypothetical protein
MFHIDGTIEIQSPQIIVLPAFSREDFLASSLFPVTEPSNQNHPYSRYFFKSISAEQEEHFQGSICFAWGRLYDFDVSSLRKEFEKDEGGKHLFHKKILEAAFKRVPDERSSWPNGEEIGVTYNFHWGNVSARIDIKTWDALIYSRYFTPEFPK